MKELIFPYSKKKGTLDVLDNVPTLNITENGEYSVKGYDKAVVNVEGGSSDFSTATITITNNMDRALQIMPTTMEDTEKITGVLWSDDTGFVIPDLSTSFEHGSTTLHACIKTGEYIFFFCGVITEASTYTVTGNAEVIPGDTSVNPSTPAVIKVTGDCTITMGAPN